MSNTQLFDVHTHTQFAAFKQDQDEAIKHALDNGIWMVNVGTQANTSRLAVETAHRYAEGVYAAVGLHPVHTTTSYHNSQELGGDDAFTSRGEAFDRGYYEKLGSDPKVVAIGECGLDYYRLESDTKQRQQSIFAEQIEVSRTIGKPLMVHCRSAFGDLVPMLAESTLADRRGIIHFFTGSVDDARKLLDLGFSFSFGGVITFARDYDEQIRFIPLDRIVLETDAPYVTPVPYRGKRNEPAYVVEVAKKIAEIKKVDLSIVGEATVRNARTVFAL